MTLNFPDSPSTGDIYNDSTSGFQYEWNGTVWISTDPQRAANIKELDDISSGFNGSTTQFNLRVSSSAVEPVSDAQILISVGGVMQNPTNDYTVSGSTITFTTAPSAGLTFFGVFLGQALSLNTVQDGTVTNTSFKAGTNGIGIQSGGTAIGVGITQLNFIGTGNTFVAIGNTVNVSVNVGGIDTTATSYFNNITASGNINVTGDLTYDEVTAVNQKISGVTTTTGLDVLGISSVKDLRSVGVTTLTSAGITNLTVSAGSTFTGAIDANGNVDVAGNTVLNGDVDLGNATSDTITATGRFDSDIVPSTDNARDLGASGLEFKDLYIDGTANIDALAADSAAIGDLTSGRVTYAGSSGELQDNAGLTFDGTTLTATRLAAPVAFTTSLTAANVDVTGITTFRDDVTFKGAAANITFDKSTDDLIWQDGAQAIFGTGGDLSLNHDSNHSYINHNGTGDLYVQTDGGFFVQKYGSVERLINANSDGNVELFHNGTKMVETTNAGAVTYGLHQITGAEAGDAQLYMYADEGDDAADKWRIKAQASDNTLRIQDIPDNGSWEDKMVFNNDGGVELYHNNSKKAQTYANGLEITGSYLYMGDGVEIRCGGGSDLRLYHDGSNSYVSDQGTGSLILLSHAFKVKNAANDEAMIYANEDGAVELYHNNSKKAETVSGGFTVTGTCTATAFAGDGSSLTGVGGTVAPLAYQPKPYLSDVNISVGLGITFNSNITLNSGTVNLRQVSVGGTVVQAYGITSVRDNGDGFEMDLISDLANDSMYFLQIPQNFVVNNAGDGNAAIGYTFKTDKIFGGYYTWGNSSGGQLANNLVNPGNSRSSPIQVAGEFSTTHWIRHSSNARLAVKSDGTLWGWGANSNGPLGQNDEVSRSSPVQIGSETTWASGSVGSCAIVTKTDGTLWGWGSELIGGIGQNDRVARSSPTQIGGGTDWATGIGKQGNGYISQAIKTDGTLWAWGYNEYGQLGVNDTTHRSSPTQIPGTSWSKLGQHTTFSYSCIRTDGTLWTWGQGQTYGALGQQNKSNYSSPKQVGGGTDWKHCSGGQYGMMAVKTDGTLWAWGRNTTGQLGQNNRTDYSSPRQIPGTTWSLCYSQPSTNMMIKTDGTLWTVGSSNEGILGNNRQTEDVSSPIQIGEKTDWIRGAVGAEGLAGLRRVIDDAAG